MKRDSTVSKSYFADAFVNRISCRFDGPKSFEEKFSTWEAAHEWIVLDRQRKLDAAERNVITLRMKLKRARDMRPPND